MDKMNFVREGEIKLPPGFRFQPTDEEIVFQYLARKVFSHPLPASVIPEINIFSFDPWELPGGTETCVLIIRTLTKHAHQVAMVIGSPLLVQRNKSYAQRGIYIPIVGIKKTTVFEDRRQYPDHASRADWIMPALHLQEVELVTMFISKTLIVRF